MKGHTDSGQYATMTKVTKNGVQATKKKPITKAMVVAVRISRFSERLLGLLFIRVMAIFQMAAYAMTMMVKGRRKKTTDVKRASSFASILGIMSLTQAAKAENNHTKNKAI